jgi:hypothetical protein
MAAAPERPLSCAPRVFDSIFTMKMLGEHLCAIAKAAMPAPSSGAWRRQRIKMHGGIDCAERAREIPL